MIIPTEVLASEETSLLEPSWKKQVADNIEENGMLNRWPGCILNKEVKFCIHSRKHGFHSLNSGGETLSALSIALDALQKILDHFDGMYMFESFILTR